VTSTTDSAVRPLHLLAEEEHGGVDLAAAERAARDLLLALGADLADESLADTPTRVARMYAELLTRSPFTATSFPNDGGYDELVVARDIPFHSLCEHHLLPFVGVATSRTCRASGSSACPSSRASWSTSRGRCRSRSG